MHHKRHGDDITFYAYIAYHIWLVVNGQVLENIQQSSLSTFMNASTQVGEFIHTKAINRSISVRERWVSISVVAMPSYVMYLT